jgi:hypothetical protein
LNESKGYSEASLKMGQASVRLKSTVHVIFFMSVPSTTVLFHGMYNNDHLEKGQFNHGAFYFMSIGDVLWIAYL